MNRTYSTGALRRPGIVVVDKDSTLADTRGRRDLCPTANPDRTWDDYHAAAAADPPLAATVALVRLLHAAGHPIHILTWAPATYLDATVGWLSRHDIPHVALQMRPTSLGPGEDSTAWKLRQLRKLSNTGAVDLVIEDWPEVVVAVERELHIPVLCVNPCYATRPQTVGGRR